MNFDDNKKFQRFTKNAMEFRSFNYKELIHYLRYENLQILFFSKNHIEFLQMYPEYLIKGIFFLIPDTESLVFFKENGAVFCSLDNPDFWVNDLSLYPNLPDLNDLIFCTVNYEKIHKFYLFFEYFKAQDIVSLFGIKKIIFRFTNGTKPYQSSLYLFIAGYGDLFIQLPIMYFIYQELLSKNLSMRFISSISKFKQIISYFNIDAEVFRTNDICHNFHIHQDTIRLPPTFEKSNFEREVSSKGVSKQADQLITDFRTNMTINKMDISFLKRRFDYVIGLQRISTTTDQQGNRVKEWNVEEAKIFILLCGQMRIGVINFEPSEKSFVFDYDCGQIPFPEVFQWLAAIDLFVGIDSSFGHACALIGTASLTMFISSDPLYVSNSLFFMPHSNNYSLFPDNNTQQIAGKRVFAIVYDILTGKKKLDKNFTPMKLKKEMVHYELVI